MIFELTRFVHLIAATVWVGGMITLGVAVAALRKAGADRDHLRAVARAFAHLSWTAMAVSVLTGIAQIELLHIRWDYPRLHLKLTLVGASILIALAHQIFAKRMSPAARGITQALLLILALGIVYAAIRL